MDGLYEFLLFYHIFRFSSESKAKREGILFLITWNIRSISIEKKGRGNSIREKMVKIIRRGRKNGLTTKVEKGRGEEVWNVGKNNGGPSGL